jgi:hypothetical protein
VVNVLVEVRPTSRVTWKIAPVEQPTYTLVTPPVDKATGEVGPAQELLLSGWYAEGSLPLLLKKNVKCAPPE